MNLSLQDEEIEVVGFAGLGGSCEGIKLVTGRSPHIVINHDPVAIAVHTANHPESMHICQNIYKAVPIDVLHAYAKAKGLKHPPKIGLGWFSPDCKHHSKAKGGKPLEKNIRDLAWVVLAWAKLPAHLRPRLIIIENVEEFADWCPLTTKGRPSKRLKGQTFWQWAKAFERYGYRMEFKTDVVAADKGTPTTRKRLVAIFRNDGLPIVWREGKFAKPTSPYVISGQRKPWRIAAECIDFSLPCPSIFDTAKQIMKKYGLRAIRPLARNTKARIAHGVHRYVLEAAEPFIIPITHTGDHRTHRIREPFRTTTCAHRGEHALISPVLVRNFHGDSQARPANDPVSTLMTGNHQMLISAFLAQHNTDMVGHDAREPVSTIVGKGCTQAVVSAGLLSLKGTDRRGGSIEAPTPAITAGGFHVAETRAFLTKFHRDGGQLQDLNDPLATGGTKARFGLIEALTALPPFGPEHMKRARQVAQLLRSHGLWDGGEFVTITIEGITVVVVDLGMRMLTPNELKLAMGFRPDYIIDRGLFADGWRPVTKTDQIRLIGNAVCPQVAEDAVEANYTPMMVSPRGVPAFAMEAAE